MKILKVIQLRNPLNIQKISIIKMAILNQMEFHKQK
jgi:hypothetical protein